MLFRQGHALGIPEYHPQRSCTALNPNVDTFCSLYIRVRHEQYPLKRSRSLGVSHALLVTIHTIAPVLQRTMLERQRELIAVGILFLVLTWVAVCLRIYARAIILKKWGHE